MENTTNSGKRTLGGYRAMETGGVTPLKKKGKWRGRRGKKGGTVGDTRYKRDKWQKPPSGGTVTKPESTLPPTPTKPYTIDKDGKVQPNITNITNEGDTYTNTINQTTGGTGRHATWVPGSDAEYEDIEETTTIPVENETYVQAWNKRKDRYMTKGQKSRMGTDKNEYNVFKDINEYINYMEKVKEYKKTKEGKEWSEKNRKSRKPKTVTKTKRVKVKDAVSGHWEYKDVPVGGTSQHAVIKN